MNVLNVENPVLRRELLQRTRIRTQQRVTRIMIFILIAVVIAAFYLIALVSIARDYAQDRFITVWRLSVGVQIFLVCLLGPAVAANAVTQEREQQTWEMLVFTLLRPGEIVIGKLIGRLTVLAILLSIFFPITFFCALMSATSGSTDNTVGAVAFLVGYATIGIMALFFTTTGLFLSLRLRRTVYATMASYAFVIGFLCLGTAIAQWMVSLGMTSGEGDFVSKSPVLWLNPLRMTVAVLDLSNPDSKFSLACGLMGYVTATLFLVLYMITGFRRFAEG
jgi:ABC-type transport system involved in multi-copper enzyme maturation permease subunit